MTEFAGSYLLQALCVIFGCFKRYLAISNYVVFTVVVLLAWIQLTLVGNEEGCIMILDDREY